MRLDTGLATYDVEERVLADVRVLLEDHPEVRSVDVTRPTPFALDAPVAVEVRGHDLRQMEEVAQEVLRRMATIEELTDVRSTIRPGHPEARVVFDRDKALEYGLDLATVSTLVGSPMVPSSSMKGSGSSSSTLTMVLVSHTPRAIRMAAATGGTPAV